MTRVYNLQLSSPDPRDHKMSLDVPLASAPTAAVSWPQWMGPVRDQGEQGCCTGFSEATEQEFLDLKAGKPLTIYSPAFVYYNERVLVDGGSADQDSGSQLRSGPKSINTYGICPESMMPYNDKVLNQVPPPAAVGAAVHKGSAYHQIENYVGSLRSCVASGYGFRLAIYVYESFESEEAARTGLIPVPDTGKEQLLGAHAIFCYGFDNAKSFNGQTGAFLVRNSWGEKWGQAGDFWLPYAAIPAMLMEAWMQHLGGPWG